MQRKTVVKRNQDKGNELKRQTREKKETDENAKKKNIDNEQIHQGNYNRKNRHGHENVLHVIDKGDEPVGPLVRRRDLIDVVDQARVLLQDLRRRKK